MRAFVVKEYAHPSQIKLTNDAPEPAPKAGEILVDVHAAGLNFFDVRFTFNPSELPRLTDVK